MAIDTQNKRMSVIGVGRPWARTVLASNVDAGQRAGIANAYPVSTFSSGTGLTSLDFMRGFSRGFGRGFSRGAG